MLVRVRGAENLETEKKDPKNLTLKPPPSLQPIHRFADAMPRISTHTIKKVSNTLIDHYQHEVFYVGLPRFK